MMINARFYTYWITPSIIKIWHELDDLFFHWNCDILYFLKNIKIIMYYIALSYFRLIIQTCDPDYKITTTP